MNQTMSYLVMILVLLADCSVELQRQAARTHCLVATIAADYLSQRWKRFLLSSVQLLLPPLPLLQPANMMRENWL